MKLRVHFFKEQLPKHFNYDFSYTIPNTNYHNSCNICNDIIQLRCFGKRPRIVQRTGIAYVYTLLNKNGSIPTDKNGLSVAFALCNRTFLCVDLPLFMGV